MNFPVVFKEKPENVPIARPKKAEKSGVNPDFSFFAEKCLKQMFKKKSPLRGELALFHQKKSVKKKVCADFRILAVSRQGSH